MTRLGYRELRTGPGIRRPAFEFFKTRVEPIFIKKRGDHARCYACHSQNNSAFHLQRLLPGRMSWTEAQSRLNIESVSKRIVPGNPTSSRLLTHPLAPEGGGDSFHSGARPKLRLVRIEEHLPRT